MNTITITAVELNDRRNNEAYVNGIETKICIDLTGSDKQAAWAKDIIERAISAAVLDGVKAGAGSRFVDPDILDAGIKGANTVFNAKASLINTSAKYWIENRNIAVSLITDLLK